MKKINPYEIRLETLIQAQAKEDYMNRLKQRQAKSKNFQSKTDLEYQEELRIEKLRKLAENNDSYREMWEAEQNEILLEKERQKRRIASLHMKKTPKPEEIARIVLPEPLKESERISVYRPSFFGKIIGCFVSNN